MADAESERLAALVRDCAASAGFSGAVRADRDGVTLVDQAFGPADRRWGVPCTTSTQFGIASGTKGFTALVVMRLVEEGTLSLDTTARSLLGDDLPLIDDEVTVEHLLSHRSGIGDYFDEDAATSIDDDAMPVPVHHLGTTESYLDVLDGHPQRERPGTTFRYNNGGFVVLALLAERAASRPFAVLADDLVFAPAGMTATAFLRSDELPPTAATGYLTTGDRTNVHHLPLIGSGDGGAYSTTADLHRLWCALRDGDVVSRSTLARMTTPVSDVVNESMRYGLGFWLHASSDVVMLEGMDAGVSFRSVWRPSDDLVHTTMSNTSDGAWPITKALDTALGVE